MSITSSNNLAVNNSLTVNGNTILGTNSTNTLIFNSKPTFNSDITISGNINQINGTFSTGSGNINLNGDVVISGTKKLTTGTGLTTINGSLQCNSGLNITGLLSSAGSIELGPTSGTNFTYIDLKTTGGNFDYDARIGVTGEFLSTSGQGALSFKCLSCAIDSPLTINGITNNNNLTQTGTATFNAINCTSINNYGSFNGINCTSINNSGTLTQTGAVTCNAINFSSISNSGTLTQTGAITSNAINCASMSNSGTLTQNGLASFGNDINLNVAQSIYIKNALSTAFLRLHHSGAGAYIDYTGGLNLRNGTGTIDTFNLNNSTNQGTFNYNLNTNGITNSSTNGITNSSTNAIANNGILYQNNLASFSSVITAPGISTAGLFYAGQAGNNFDTTAITSPRITNGIVTGTADGASYTAFNLAINSWNGVGFVYSNPDAPSVCKLVVDNRSGNFSTLGTITCNTLNTTNYNAGTTYNTGSIYMTNASPINLKSNTDPNHYVQYDSVYDGPQIGVFTGTSIKCTDNNAIKMNATKTAMNINVNTTITGTCTVSNKFTVENGMVLNGEINESRYYTIKGNTYNTVGSTNYYYKLFDGTNGSSASENIQIHLSSRCAKITCCYNSTFPSNIYQGSSEYMVYGSNYTGIDRVWYVGALQYQPVITCNSSGLINIEFAKTQV